MAVIQNKIATRTWSKNQYGDAALTYSTGNDCLVWDSLNQTSSANNISPTSKTNGAIPNTKTPPITQSYKCVTQDYIDSIYIPYNINIVTTLTKHTNTNKKQFLINAFYKNPGDETSTVAPPSLAPLLENGYVNQNLNISVTIIYKEVSLVEGPIMMELVEKARTTISGIIYSSAVEGVMRKILTDMTVFSTIDTPTGTLDNTIFIAAYWDKMYSYFSKPNTFNVGYSFEIETTITPTYSLPLNSTNEVQQYVKCEPPVQTIENTTSTSTPSDPSTVTTYATLIYNCTSGPSTGSSGAIWNFNAYAYDLTPAYSSSMDFIALANTGTITYTSSYNSLMKRFDMTGTVTGTTSEMPKVTLRYGTKNATSSIYYFEQTYLANIKQL